MTSDGAPRLLDANGRTFLRVVASRCVIQKRRDAASVVASAIMSMPVVTPVVLPLTPCIGVCRLDAQGFCVGCQRTGAEIASWRTLPDDERLRFMEEVLPARTRP